MCGSPMKKKSIAKVKQVKEPRLKEDVRSSLEEQIRQQSDELEIQKGKLKQGVDRERLGADREKRS